MRPFGHIFAAGVGSVCLLACAHPPTPGLGESDNESKAALWAQCQKGDFDACIALREEELGSINWSEPLRPRPELLAYAEPAAMQACRLNAFSCERFLWTVWDIGLPPAQLLKTRSVLAHLAEACRERKYADACGFLGRVDASQQQFQPAARAFASGCRLLASGDDAGCCQRLVELYEQGKVARPAHAVEAVREHVRQLSQHGRTDAEAEMLMPHPTWAAESERLVELLGELEPD
jgi:hypothetical protein